MRLRKWNWKQRERPKGWKIKPSFSDKLYFVNNCYKEYERSNAITQSCHLVVVPRKTWKSYRNNGATETQAHLRKTEKMRRLACNSSFSWFICSGYRRCSRPWLRSWSNTTGTDSWTVISASSRQGSWTCCFILSQYTAKPPYLLYDSCRVGTGPGSDTNPPFCCGITTCGEQMPKPQFLDSGMVRFPTPSVHWVYKPNSDFSMTWNVPFRDSHLWEMLLTVLYLW